MNICRTGCFCKLFESRSTKCSKNEQKTKHLFKGFYKQTINHVSSLILQWINKVLCLIMVSYCERSCEFPKWQLERKEWKKRKEMKWLYMKWKERGSEWRREQSEGRSQVREGAAGVPHFALSLLSSKKRTKCTKSPCASPPLMSFLRTSALCYRQILSAGWWCWSGGGWTQQSVRRRRKTHKRKNSGSAVLELDLQRKKKKKKSPRQLQRHICNLGRGEEERRQIVFHPRRYKSRE